MVRCTPRITGETSGRVRSVDLVKQNALTALPQAADNAPGRL
jgi:hypothetical protein